MNVHIRKYIYAILIAIGPIVAFYGLATHEEIALWMGVGATILAVPGSSLALNNLTKAPEKLSSTYATVNVYNPVDETVVLGKHGVE